MVRFRKLRGEQEDADRSTAQGAPAEAEADEEPLEEALSEDVEADQSVDADEAGDAAEADEGEDPLDDLLDDDLDGELEDDQDGAPEDLDTDGEDDGGMPAGLEDASDSTALKELAARMAVLQSNLENVQGSRGDLEDKLSTMEDRMLRLGNLAEAVSKEYNPFIAENSPDEPTWQGQPDRTEDPEDPPAAAAEPQVPEPAPPEPTSPPEPEAGAPGSEDETAQMPGAASDLSPEPPGGPAGQEGPEEDPVAEALGGLTGPMEPEQDPIDALESFSQQTGGSRSDPMEALQENFMMLEWVGLMLRRVGRANLLDLLEYYEGLGWMSPGIKQRVVRVAVGIDAPDDGTGGEWRGDLDLHERSLVTIQRLEGNEITAADVEGLRMDMRRYFGE